MEKGHQGNSIEISRIGKFSFLFFFNRIVPTMISGKRVSELVSKKMRKGQGNTKHFQCTPSHSEWNLKSAEWKHLGRRMEESETQRMRGSCFSAGKVMMSRTVIFTCLLYPHYEANQNRRGLNIVPLNPSQYSKVYCLELRTDITKICVQISESAQAREFPWAP